MKTLKNERSYFRGKNLAANQYNCCSCCLMGTTRYT